MEKKAEKSIKISLSVKDVANLVGETCSECYGVVGLTNAKSIKEKLIILKKENYVEGVNVTKENGKFNVDVHLICAYGIKITEIVSEVSKRINYVLTKKYGQLFSKINVYVEELRDL